MMLANVHYHHHSLPYQLVMSSTLSCPSDEVLSLVTDQTSIASLVQRVDASLGASSLGIESKGGSWTKVKEDMLGAEVAETRSVVYEVRKHANLSSVSSLYFEFVVQVRGSLECDLAVRAWYDVKYGVLGAVVDTLSTKRRMNRLLWAAISGIKHQVETGRAVGADFKSPARRASFWDRG
jgi:hypothetical protein